MAKQIPLNPAEILPRVEVLALPTREKDTRLTKISTLQQVWHTFVASMQLNKLLPKPVVSF